MSDFDTVIIGAGPAGYVAAIRCAQLGMRVACVDERSDDAGKPSPGGACLNVGCIPSKALLDSSEQFARLNHQFAAHGITAENVKLDVGAMQQRKEKIVTKLTGGIAQLFKANKIAFLHGRAQLRAGRKVAVTAADGNENTLTATNIILAPGGAPIALPGIAFDGECIVDSAGALAFDRVPPRLGVIGAGVIGLELGSVWRRLGAEVTVLEGMDEFLPAADAQIAREAARQFKKQGLNIQLGATVKSAARKDDTVAIEYTQKDATQQLTVDKLIVAVGRKPATDNLFADDCGVTTDARGFIKVDAHCRTVADNIWAIGDAVRGPMLAHKGSEEGVAVAERIAADNVKVGHVDFNTVPWVIYTAPEIAWVGMTEKELVRKNIPHKIGTFPFAATGRALAMDEPAGMVKLIAHATTDTLLGAHIVGAHASELIAECVLAMEYRASAEDLARTIHAHPTLSEAVHEAALAVGGRAVHKAR